MPPWGGRDLFRVHHTGHVALTAAGRGGGLGQVGYSILTEGGGVAGRQTPMYGQAGSRVTLR